MAVAHTKRKQLSARIADELQLSTLGSSLLSALVIGIFEIIVVVSFAALIFSGELASQMPRALGFIIVGDAILCLTVALLSSYPGAIAVEQDTPGAVLGVVAVAIVAAIPATSGQQFATVVMMIIVTTVMAGVVFLMLGIFKLGGLVRFLPYPVIGGFLAGTGWLLTIGGIGAMVDTPLGVAWFEPRLFSHWLPGALLGVMIFISVRRFNKPFTLPLILGIAIVLFYMVSALTNTSFEQLGTQGWLLSSIPSGNLWQFPLNAEILSQVNWPVLLSQLPSLAPAAIISVIALLLNAGGLELLIKRDINLNRELIAAGVGNLAAGSMGGLIGYQAISLSALNQTMSGGKRLVGVLTALTVGATIFFGASVLIYIPKMMLGAVLVFLGIALLFEWIYEAWFKFTKIDFGVILSILAVIILSGFLQGILTGLVLTIIMFVLSYSRVGVIKFALSGTEYRSRVTRGAQQQQILEAHGDQLYILKLQGFIFFGTANSIFDQVREYVENKPAHAVRFVLLDFAQVSGLDSTGLLSFTRMLQWGQEKRVTLVLASLSERMRDQFRHSGLRTQPGCLHFSPDLDHGVEWCENEIITAFSTATQDKTSLAAQLMAIMNGVGDAEELVHHMNRREFAAGDYLIRQGDEPDMIFFIESGQVTAQVEAPGKSPLRLETMRGGRTVGELGFYLGIPRTAAVVVDEPSVIYSLSRQELTHIEGSHAEVANVFHRIIVRLLGERVVHLIRTVNALER